jgi:UDP:flavonoid glycosyltransferase YjiC (YdhE family)
MRILFACLGAYGHLYPLMPLARACADAGHEAVMATGEPFLGRLPLPTVPAYPPEHTLGSVFAEARRRHPDLHGVDASMAMFADVTAETVAATLIPQLESMAPDLVVYEAMNTGAGVAADVVGIPAAAYAIALARMIYARLHAATVAYHREIWVERGLTPPDGTPLLASALIDPTPESLQSYGATTSPTIPIRSVPYNETAATIPPWLTWAPTRPRVYLTLGTVSYGAVEVLARAVEAIGRLDVELLVTVGPEGDPAALGPVPEHVHVERFVAQSNVLPQVDLIVHHGGTGTVLCAIESGLPQLLLPQGADQFFNADTLTAAGAARSLVGEAQQPAAIAEAVEAMLGDCPERQVAQRLRQETAALPSPADALPQVLALAHAAA